VPAGGSKRSWGGVMAEKCFGVDIHPVYQRLFDFKRARRAGYRYAIVKASQGDKYVPSGFRDFFKRGEAAGLLMGAYVFLERGPSGRAQAEHFLEVLDRVGGVRNKLICVDFESYGDGGKLSPTNEQLFSCNTALQKELRPDQELGIYSTVGFWNGGDPSGPFAQYKADYAWEARVWSGAEKRWFPKRFYPRWRRWYMNQSPRGLGGQAARMRQFTWGGHVGGLFVDTDCWEGDFASLQRKAGV
jgi:hypothetical protein